MEEEVKIIVESAEELMEKSVEHLDQELLKIRAGKANPVMLDGLRVDYYGAPTPLVQLAGVSAQDARMLVVSPYDRKSIQAIERAIIEANLGFNPQNDGIVIRIPIPQLSEERRKQLVKQARDEGEHAKIAVRNIRRDHNDQLKKLKDEHVSEDQIKLGETKVQEVTDTYVHRIDDILKKKEGEIMTI
jgi:ribosome recycling factor